MCPCRTGGKDTWRWEKFSVVQNGITQKGTDMSAFCNDRAISSPKTSEQDKCFTCGLNLTEEIHWFSLTSVLSVCLQMLLCASTMLAMKSKCHYIGLYTLEVLSSPLQPAPKASHILTQGGSPKSNTCLKFRHQK